MNARRLIDSVVAISLTMQTMSVFGYEPGRALANYAHELADCAAFFSAMSQCAENTNPDDPLSGRLMQQAETLIQLSARASNAEVASARLVLGIQELGELMKNDCSNTSIAILKYQDVCKEVSNTPDARLQYWLDKKD